MNSDVRLEKRVGALEAEVQRLRRELAAMHRQMVMGAQHEAVLDALAQEVTEDVGSAPPPMEEMLAHTKEEAQQAEHERARKALFPPSVSAADFVDLNVGAQEADPQHEEPTWQARAEEPRWHEPRPDWRETLRKVHLWPPAAEEGQAEVQLGAWWATRIGMLLAVIGFVSFSVYMNLSPVLRLGELLLAALAVTFAGWRLERNNAQFGRVVFAGGLAALYFTSFAAYAVDATKVINSPGAATIVQLVAALCLSGVAVVRNAPGLAVLTTVFGYAAAGFAIYTGLSTEALAMAAVFAGAGLVLHVVRRWTGPLLASIPLTHGMFLVLAFKWVAQHVDPGLMLIVVFPAGTMALFAIADMLRGLDADETASGDDADAALMRGVWRRWALLCSSTLALAGGWIAMHTQPLEMRWVFYGVMTLVSGGAAFAWHLRGRHDGVTQTYGFKAAMLCALAIGNRWHALPRWMTLVAESGILGFAARRTRLRVYQVASAVVWVSAAVNLLRWAGDAGYFRTPLDVMEWRGLLVLTFMLGSGVLLTLLERWFSEMKPVDVTEPMGIARRRMGFDGALLTVLLGVVAVVGSLIVGPNEYRPVVVTGFAALIALGGRIGRGRVGVFAAVIPFMFAHLWLWLPHHETLQTSTLNATIVIVCSVIWGWWLAKRSGALARGDVDWVAFGIHALWLFTLNVVCSRHSGVETLLLIDAGVVIAVALAGGVLRDAALGQAAALPLFFATMMIWKSELGEEISQARALYATGLALGGIALTQLWEPFVALWGGSDAEGEMARRRAGWTFSALGLWGALLGLRLAFDTRDEVFAFALLPLAIALVARDARLKPAILLANVFIIVAAYNLIVLLGSHVFHSAAAGEALAPGLVLAAGAVAYGVALKHSVVKLDREQLAWLLGFNAAIGMAAGYLAVMQHGSMARFYVTAMWSVMAMAVWGIGLFERARSMRVVALVGVALALARVFLVDAQSTFDRIIAFFALGGVLLVIGFLYHRFAGRIAVREEEAPAKV